MQRRGLRGMAKLGGVLLFLFSANVVAQPAPGRGDVAPMLEGALDPETYIVGPGDKIGVQLFGLQPTTLEAEVGVEGSLIFPRVGAVQVAGLTLVQARARIGDWLKKTYPRLGANVSLLEARRFVVHVTGAVARPGTYAATPLTRASALLPIAGGVLPSGSSRVVELRHRGPPARTTVVDL